MGCFGSPGWRRGAGGTNDVEAGNAGQVSEGQHRGVKTNSTATCSGTQSPAEKQESLSSSPPEKTLIGTCTNFHATTEDVSQMPPRKRFPQGLGPLQRLKRTKSVWDTVESEAGPILALKPRIQMRDCV